MITKVEDIKGNILNIGDDIAWGDTTSTSNAVICYGKIVDIQKKKLQTHIFVQPIKEGGYFLHNSIKVFIYPRNYHNIIKL